MIKSINSLRIVARIKNKVVNFMDDPKKDIDLDPITGDPIEPVDDEDGIEKGVDLGDDDSDDEDTEE